MMKVMDELGGDYLDKACFVAQPADVPYRIVGWGFTWGGQAISWFNSLGQWRKSPDMKDQAGRNIPGIYKLYTDYVRNWYSNTLGMNAISKLGYNCDFNGEIHKIRNVGGNGYEVADIYPARKLVMMVIFLMTLYSKCYMKFDFDDYKKMIASYIVYANLFNSWCAVKMEKTWNKKSYVYIYNNQGERPHMDITSADIEEAN